MADYVGKDFIDSYSEVLEFVKDSSNWDPSTSNEANPGVVVLKAFCLLADKLQYKIDINTAQAYLPTVSDRQTAFEVLLSLGYVMKEAKSASGRINMTLRGDATSKALPIFTQVTDDSNTISFFTTSDATITQGTIAVPVLEGSPFLIEKEGVDRYSIKDIDEDGRFFLQKSGIAQNGVFVGVFGTDDAIDYTTWKNIEGSVLYPETKHFYYIMTDENGENYIQFPKDFAELFGSSEFQVMATFTKGAAGNITKGTISKLANNALADVVVRQISDISNGIDSEDIKKATERYYETMQVFNTLVTAHDYNAALRYVLNDGARIFSNAYARTARDRQTKIITRDGTIQYAYRQFSSAESDRVIDALCLKYSQDYSESFQVVTPSAQTEAQIVEAFDGANALATEIDMKDSNRLLAVTNLVGTVFANVSTAAQGNQVMANIISSLKGKYQASELSFGKKFDYQTLVNDIKAADNRISNVALNIPEYQIYKKFQEVDGQSQYLDSTGSAEKTKIVAEAVLAGRLPLYKYLNRPNSNSASANIQYRPIPFNAEEVKSFPEATNPQVVSFDNNTLVWTAPTTNELANGKVVLSKNQILQFNKILHVGTVDYGYGYKYAFYRRGDSGSGLKEAMTLAANSSFTAGTIFAKDSQLIISSADQISESLEKACTKQTLANGDFKLTVTAEDGYTVGSKVNLLTNSVLEVGTIISNSSQVDSSQWSPFEIKDGQEYKLKPGETLELVKSSGSGSKITFGEGQWIQPSGLSIPDNGTSGSTTLDGQILQASQKITILGNDASQISEDFLYFMKLNGKTSINLPYMLEEGEYFVYADSALSEYVILGAGTILETDASTSQALDNVVSVEIVEDATESSFKRLGISITATATETTTYTSDDDVKIKGTGFGTNVAIPSEYTPILSSQTFEVINNDGTGSEVFSSEEGYRYRVAVYIASDQSGQAVITGGVQVVLSDGTKTISLQGQAQTDFYIATSAPFQTVLSKLQTGASPTRLFPEGQEQLITTYQKAREINNDIADFDFPTNASVRVSITGLTADNKTLEIPLNLFSTSDLTFEKVLFNMTVTASTGQTFSFTIGGKANNATPNITTTILGKASQTVTQTDPNIYTVSVNKATNYSSTGTNQSSIVLTFSNFSGIDANHPLEILFSDLAYVTDYSDEVKNVEMENGNQLAASSPDYYSPALSSGVIETQIDALQTTKKFSWLCTPDEKVTHPTKSSEFFASEHPRNYCTIPYIDFNKSENTLKIISTSGAILR